MSSGSSKEAMDTAVVMTDPVESIEERQARSKLWSEVRTLIRVASRQVMSLIDGMIPRPDSTREEIQEEMVEILTFSCEHVSAVLKDEPLDEKTVWQDYDNSRKLLDIVVLLPAEWTKLLEEASAWRQDPPKFAGVPRVAPLGKADFDKLKKMPYKYRLHLDNLPTWEPKYKIAS